MPKADGVARVTTSLKDGSFFKKWLHYIRPCHNLTDREIEVAALFLYERYLLSKAISEPKILDKVLFGTDTKKKIMKICGLKPTQLHVYIGKMKRLGMIVDNSFNDRYIPKVIEGSTGYVQLIYFDWSHDLQTDNSNSSNSTESSEENSTGSI